MFAHRPALNMSRSYYTAAPDDAAKVQAAVAAAAGTAAGVAGGSLGLFVIPEPALSAVMTPGLCEIRLSHLFYE
jgi:hypothetical protein